MVSDEWRRPSACVNENHCAEVHMAETVAVRSTTAPDTVLTFTRADWNAFITGVREGEFDVV